MNKKERERMKSIIERIDKKVCDRGVTKDLNLLRAIVLIEEEKQKPRGHKSRITRLHEGLGKYLSQAKKSGDKKTKTKEK